MYQDLRLHGHLNESIEYFASAAARDVTRCFFYESGETGLRFFSPGNELVLDQTSVSHRGNGGTFCEYMFGVDMPLADLAKEEVRNRLVLYGGAYESSGSLHFNDQTEGRISFERIFFEGNAVCNYFFFLTGSVSGPLHEQQEGLLRLLGKLLKRSAHVGDDDSGRLIEELFTLLGHRSSFYLVKLIHKRHKIYHDTFHDLYYRHRHLPDREFAELQQLAAELEIDRYQQERIRIDVMYKHPDNRRIVDEYKNILIACDRKGSISKLENARLTRLKTLSVRNKIPAALFYTLDEMLKNDKHVDVEEHDYLSSTRQILAGLFLQEHQIDASVDREDMIKLLDAKRRASENRDHAFEQILLETGKACDEKIRDGADIALLESFSSIVTYFDRYDNTSAHINQLAFMENGRFSEEMIRSLLGNKKAFDELQTELFQQLFFRDLFENKYLGQYGRKKLQQLRQGLSAIEQSRMSIEELLQRLRDIDRDERLYGILLVHIKDRIRNFYSRYNTKTEQTELLEEITEELRHKGLLEGEIPPPLFFDIVVNIKKEAVYLHNLLPRIVAEHDQALREDFLENSGLDRFYVEELEREYFELNGLDIEELYQIRKGLNA